jgi:hypothetical protein
MPSHEQETRKPVMWETLAAWGLSNHTGLDNPGRWIGSRCNSAQVTTLLTEWWSIATWRRRRRRLSQLLRARPGWGAILNNGLLAGDGQEPGDSRRR